MSEPTNKKSNDGQGFLILIIVVVGVIMLVTYGVSTTALVWTILGVVGFFGILALLSSF